nr:hypothetical protein [Tanacetum cinerariifolium]
MKAQPEITQNISSLKLPMLKTGDYDLWTVGTVVPPKTEAQKLARKNELKAKSTLLLAIPDEHLLKFHLIKDANINETVNVAHDVPAAGSKEQPLASSYVDDVMFSFFASQSNTSQLENKDLEQIDTDDLEEMVLKWQLAMITMRGNRSANNERRVVLVETPASSLVVQNGLGGYDWSYQAKEGPTDFALMAHSSNSANSSNSEEIREEPKTVRSSAPIIEDWESDSKDECEDKTSTEQEISSNDNSVKSIESTKKYISEKHTNNHDENLRKRHDSRVDWNGIKTQKQGIGFEFNKTACFVCGSVNHLIKDCTFYENKMVEKSMVNNKGKGTGQRKVRPVWNNARMVNHQNFSKMTHPHPKRKFIRTTVANKLGQVLVNVAKQNSVASTSTARPKVNTAAIRPNVNPKSSYFKSHFPKRRHFNQRSAAKTNTFSRKINSTKGKNVTTTGPKAVVNAAEGKKENVVKSSACWIWRPKGKLIDHTSKDSGSYTLKRFNYVDPNGRLKSAMAWVPKRN